MNNLGKTIIGIMLQVQKTDSYAIFKKIKLEWFTSEQEKACYDVFSELISNDMEINLLTTVVKAKDKYKNLNMPVFLSECSSTVKMEHLLNVETVIAMLRYSYVSRSAKNTMTSLQMVVQMEDIDFDKYLEILQSGIDEFTNEMKEQVNTLNNVIQEVLDRHDRAKSGDIGGIVLGWNHINDDIILEPVDMMVVGARPAMGKTSFAVACIVQLAFHEKRKVAVFNLEMSNTQYMRRIISNLTGIDSAKIKKGLCSPSEMQKIYDVVSMKEMKNIHLFEGSHNVQQIRIKLNELKYQSGVDVVIVDYLQKISAESGTSRYEQVTFASNGLKRISQDLHIPSIALAQLGRDAGKHKGRPILPDLRDSGEIEQDASIVAFLHRPEYYGIDQDENGNSTAGIAEFIIAKNREGEMPIVEFLVDLKTNRWTERKNVVSPQPVTITRNWYDNDKDDPF